MFRSVCWDLFSSLVLVVFFESTEQPTSRLKETNRVTEIFKYCATMRRGEEREDGRGASDLHLTDG
jgi:hypothetical protein